MLARFRRILWQVLAIALVLTQPSQYRYLSFQLFFLFQSSMHVLHKATYRASAHVSPGIKRNKNAQKKKNTCAHTHGWLAKDRGTCQESGRVLGVDFDPDRPGLTCPCRHIISKIHTQHIQYLSISLFTILYCIPECHLNKSDFGSSRLQAAGRPWCC